jgi:FdhD protein
MSEDVSGALLRALAEDDAPVSVPRLGKRLGVGASVVMRALTLMGDAVLGGQAGPGWVHMRHEEGRWMASLTDAGRQHCAQRSHG